MPELHKVMLSLDAHNSLIVCPDSIAVDRGDTVVWRIENVSDVQWIRIGTAGHPFTTHLPSGTWNGFKVVVRPGAPVGVWKYSIEYRTARITGIKDPKIAVKSHAFTFTAVVIGLAVILIPTMIFFRNNIISFFKGKSKTHN